MAYKHLDRVDCMDLNVNKIVTKVGRLILNAC